MTRGHTTYRMIETCEVDNLPTKLGWAVAEESWIGTSNRPVSESVGRARSSPTVAGRDSSSKFEMLGGDATGVFKGGEDEPNGTSDWVLPMPLLLPSSWSPTITSLLPPITL